MGVARRRNFPPAHCLHKRFEPVAGARQRAAKRVGFARRTGRRNLAHRAAMADGELVACVAFGIYRRVVRYLGIETDQVLRRGTTTSTS